MTDVDTATHRQQQATAWSLSEDRLTVGSVTSPLCKKHSKFQKHPQVMLG